MYKSLKEMMENNKIGDFLFPSIQKKIKGKITYIDQEMVVVDSSIDGDVYQFITHPNTICIVQKKV